MTTIFLGICVFLNSCKGNKTVSRQNNKIFKIVLATGGCFGQCPIQVFSMDSSLTIRYHGQEFTDRKGFYIGKFDQSLWDSLNYKLELLNFEKLDTTYDHSVDDQSTEIYIYHKNGTKHIRGQSESLPKLVMTFYKWLFDRVSKIPMDKTPDSLIFETKIQIPLPPERLPSMPEYR